MSGHLFIGKNLIELDSVSSTNTYLKTRMNETPLPDGTVVITREQSAGRGQQGASWFSEPGSNITLSVLLYPEFLDADKQFYLNMAVSLGVKDFCEFIIKDEVKIKWPNDIYHLNRKLGGILIENTITGQRLSTSVVGIGLNVNQKQFDASLPNPVSMAQITGQSFDIPSLMNDLCAFIEKYYLQLRQQHYNFLERAYTDSLFRYQQTHEFKKSGQVFKGEINGVTKEGKLVIHCQGKEQRFAFKEVEYVI